jgi:hypothetical protein
LLDVPVKVALAALLMALVTAQSARTCSSGWSEQRTGVAGTAVYTGGEFIAQDHIWPRR